MFRRPVVDGCYCTRYFMHFFYNDHPIKCCFDTLAQMERFAYLNEICDFDIYKFDDNLGDYKFCGSYHLSATLNSKDK